MSIYLMTMSNNFYKRYTLRYFSDCTSAEVAIQEPKIKTLLKNKCSDFDTFVAVFTDEKTVGVGWLYKNKMHPYREYIHLYIKKEHQNKTCISMIFNALKEKAKSLKLQCMVPSEYKYLSRFLLSEGFTIARKCFEFNLDNKILNKNIDFDYALENTNIKKVSKLSKADENKLAKLIFDYYVETHKNINPLNRLVSYLEFYSQYISPFNKEKSTVLYCNKIISAYMILYGGGKKMIEVGYIGGKTLQEINCYLVYYKTEIKKLLQIYKKLSFEIDNVDPCGMALIKSLNINCKKSYDTYVYQ